MNPPAYLLDLDRLGSSYLLLLSFLGVGVIAGLLFWVGWVGLALQFVQAIVRAAIRGGFWLWQRLLAWARWPAFLGMVLVLLVVGVVGGGAVPALAVVGGALLFFLGIVTCLAYIWIDLERYEVARGYKALHNPLKGQGLAVNLVRYGRHVGAPLLIAATVGLVGGFALLNQGLYATVGQHWYRVGSGQATPTFADFLAYTLINLFRVVDLLGIAESYNYVHVTFVHQARWPAATLLAGFRTFFTLVLLQQIFASVRRGRLLAETISDFWSPHPPIHERARGSLPQHGPGAVWPLLLSLRTIDVLTAEQRIFIPRIIADIGPATIPILVRHLDDPHEHVRASVVGALGHLRALDAVPVLIHLERDPNEWVRQSLAEALGIIGGPNARATRKRRPVRVGATFVRRWVERVLRRREPQAPAVPADPIALAVSTLRAILADSSAAVRIQAVQSLGQIGPPAAASAPDLIGCLKEADEAFRCRAAEALGQVAGPADETVPALIELLQDPSPMIRVSAARALGELKKAAAAAVPALMPLLQEAEESVRQVAAEALGQIGTLQKDAIGTLRNGLASKDNVERAQTAEALGTIGEAAADAAPALADALNDTNDRVRAKAAEALGKIGEAGCEAVPHLVRALRDKDNWVSALAAEALGEMGESATDAIPGLVRSLRHMTAQVRVNAAEALGKMGAAAHAAVAPLEQALQDEEDRVRSSAIVALGEIGHLTERAGRNLLAALHDPNPTVRAAAVEAVGKREELKEPGTTALLHAVEDVNDQVKIAVTSALPKLAGATPPVLESLGRLLGDDNAEVQAQAALALGKLGTAAAGAGGALLRVAQTGEAEVREAALRAIAIIQPAEATTAFLAGLKSAQPEIRRLASAGLVKAAELLPDVISDLIEALRDPEIQVRTNAARVLSRLEEVPMEAVPPLLECAGDINDALRTNAALALRLAPPSAVGQLFGHLLEDTNPRLQLIAAGYLLNADPDNAQAAAVLGNVLSDPSVRLRKAALELLESLGERAAAVSAAIQARTAIEMDPELSDLLARLIDRLDRSPSPASAAPPVEP